MRERPLLDPQGAFRSRTPYLVKDGRRLDSTSPTTRTTAWFVWGRREPGLLRLTKESCWISGGRLGNLWEPSQNFMRAEMGCFSLDARSTVGSISGRASTPRGSELTFISST